MAISMLKIRRPLGRLIFNMGIAIPGKTVFLIETAPCNLQYPSCIHFIYICVIMIDTVINMIGIISYANLNQIRQ